MKKYIYLILGILLFTTQSCVKDEKDIFEQPANERIAAAQKNCLDALVAAPNGWIMSYYAKTTTVGGFQFLVSFTKDGVATFSAENILSNQDPTMKIQSLFKLKGDQGPVLSFDTYNKFLHTFSSPNPDSKGFEGDYEFIIMSTTADQIVLKGKKSGSRIVLNKFTKTEPIAWEAFMTTLNTMKVNVFSTRYLMKVGTKQFVVNEDAMRIMSFSNIENGNLKKYSAPYIFTEKGIEFYDNITVEGQTFKTFEWNSTSKSLVCKDAGTTVSITPIPVPVNELFMKSTSYWLMTTDAMSDDFKAGFAAAQKANSDKGEKLSYVVFTYNTGGKVPVIMFGAKDAANKSLPTMLYISNYTLALNSIEKMTINSISPNNAAALNYYNLGYKGLIDKIYGQDFILTTDNPSNPTKITFTNAKDPSSWYTLSAM